MLSRPVWWVIGQNDGGGGGARAGGRLQTAGPGPGGAAHPGPPATSYSSGTVTQTE